jgi:acyl carrier protein
MMIDKRLAGVILRQLGLESFPLEDSTHAFEVPGWDSLRHASILAAVEDEFAIRFKNTEVMRLKNIGDLQRLVERKLSTAK